MTKRQKIRRDIKRVKRRRKPRKINNKKGRGVEDDEYEEDEEQVGFGKGNFIFTKSNTRFTDDYELKETLGEGGYGTVGKCKKKNTQNITKK